MTTICAYAQFTLSKVGVNSLTVTWDVERITRSDGTRYALVTGGANSITVGRRGLYGYVLADADLTLYDYVFTAITAGTVDQNEVAAMWTYFDIHALRPTTADRTLDVAATGEAGLDFDNVKQATAPTTLSGITVPTVTTLTNAPAATISEADQNEIAQKVWNNTIATTRTLTTPATQIVSAIENSELAIARNVDFDAVITGLSIPANWTKIYATIKRLKTDTDAKSQLQVAVRNPADPALDGLVFINKEPAGANRTRGALIASASGTIAWSIEDDVTSLLEVGDYSYDVKALTPSGTILLAGSTDALIYDTETYSLS